ncbi:MAG: lysozyme [Chlorobiaceae bacterium]|nr:lysozyme [Chlorobiaceae bacterium]
MKASGKLIALIESSEGFSPKPYLCPAGVPTIGYGSTRYADGRPVKLPDPPINDLQAVEIMRAALAEYEAAVNRYVAVRLNQNQFDALVDFAYNVGAQNLRTSTLLKLVNQGKLKEAADEFGRWVVGGGKKLPGLVRRREAERKLFLS